jgi:hypothetical protein
MAGRAHGAGRGASVSDPREHYCDEAQTQAHHHLLEPPSGKTTTHGVCKLCGFEMEHVSAIDRLPWTVQERANQMER